MFLDRVHLEKLVKLYNELKNNLNFDKSIRRSHKEYVNG